MSAIQQRSFEPGDTIFAATELTNDGSIPGLAEKALVAKQGTRGVVINIGHFEDQPNRELYLVRFENEDLSLGPLVGCWPEEIVPAEDIER